MDNTTRRNEGAAMYYLSSAQFKSKLAGAKLSGLNMQKGFHTLLMAALAESVPEVEGGHKNATPFLQIITALPDAVRKSDVKRWIEAHSNARITTNTGKAGITFGVKMIGPDKDGYKTVNFARAAAHPFYQDIAKADKDVLLMDDAGFAKALAALVGKAARAEREGKLVLSTVNAARLAELKNMKAAAEKAAA